MATYTENKKLLDTIPTLYLSDLLKLLLKKDEESEDRLFLASYKLTGSKDQREGTIEEFKEFIALLYSDNETERTETKAMSQRMGISKDKIAPETFAVALNQRIYATRLKIHENLAKVIGEQIEEQEQGQEEGQESKQVRAQSYWDNNRDKVFDLFATALRQKRAFEPSDRLKLKKMVDKWSWAQGQSESGDYRSAANAIKKIIHAFTGLQVKYPGAFEEVEPQDENLGIRRRAQNPRRPKMVKDEPPSVILSKQERCRIIWGKRGAKFKYAVDEALKESRTNPDLEAPLGLETKWQSARDSADKGDYVEAVKIMSYLQPTAAIFAEYPDFFNGSNEQDVAVQTNRERDTELHLKSPQFSDCHFDEIPADAPWEFKQWMVEGELPATFGYGFFIRDYFKLLNQDQRARFIEGAKDLTTSCEITKLLLTYILDEDQIERLPSDYLKEKVRNCNEVERGVEACAVEAEAMVNSLFENEGNLAKFIYNIKALSGLGDPTDQTANYKSMLKAMGDAIWEKLDSITPEDAIEQYAYIGDAFMELGSTLQEEYTKGSKKGQNQEYNELKEALGYVLRPWGNKTASLGRHPKSCKKLTHSFSSTIPDFADGGKALVKNMGEMIRAAGGCSWCDMDINEFMWSKGANFDRYRGTNIIAHNPKASGINNTNPKPDDRHNNRVTEAEMQMGKNFVAIRDGHIVPIGDIFEKVRIIYNQSGVLDTESGTLTRNDGGEVEYNEDTRAGAGVYKGVAGSSKIKVTAEPVVSDLLFEAMTDPNHWDGLVRQRLDGQEEHVYRGPEGSESYQDRLGSFTEEHKKRQDSGAIDN